MLGSILASTEPAPPAAARVSAPQAPATSTGSDGPELLVPAPDAAADGVPAQPGFSEHVVFSNLVEPIAIEFASNGHVFVAEKGGVIKEFTSLTDTTADVWADFRAEVHNHWDRGLLGMALDPNFPATPRIYVAYTYDAPPGGTAPTWGTSTSSYDTCPDPPGTTKSGCVVTSRLSALTKLANGSVTEQVLVHDWCQQYPSHSISDIVFGPDGYLYVGHGDGASFNYADYGQQNASVPPSSTWPNNPCGDPPGGVGGSMTMPTAEGGSLRSQDIRTPPTAQDPLGLDGTIIRINPATGAGAPGNPLASSSDANAKRIIATGFRNPFRMTFRPGTGELWFGDVGQSTWEEVDRISDTTPSSVLNFGWPCREGNSNGPSPFPTADLCNTPGVTYTAPVWTYSHYADAVPSDCTHGQSASVSGIAFATSATSYPALYNGALFVADYSRKCIWTIPIGSNGQPTTAAAFKFADAANPVQLKFGPDGDLYYVDFQAVGYVRRISYETPVARITADQTSGVQPLAVHFSGTSSSTPNPPLSYAWDLDGDGQYDDSTASAPVRTYTAPGQVTVRLRVTDANGKQDTDSVVIDVGQDDPPVPTIATPSASFTWTVGELVTFGGSATDDEDGTLPASALDWTLILQHCPSDCHEHIVQAWEGVSGGSFTAPDHEYPSHLELRLTATDSYGHVVTVSRTLQPKTAVVTLESQPSGLQLTFAGETGVTPFDVTVIRGSASTLVAPNAQTLAGVTYAFDSWAHGGLASQDVVVNGASATWTANYAATFGDSATSPFLADIRWAAANGITAGCGGGNFCPKEPVTREQMASFLVRALGLDAGATPDHFGDIAGSQHRYNINRLATAGITGGCGGGSFCPKEPVTREQMASFLARALSLDAGATPDRFGDIAASQHRSNINRLAAVGITGGCGGGNFCPTGVVTREQMVAFLRRALE